MAASQEAIANPYGDATVRYDEYGTPHIFGADELSLYFAVGYIQAKKRGFQLDAKRKEFRGQLAETFGPEYVDSDRFTLQMDFKRAAAATWDLLAETDTGPIIEAFTKGVNSVFESGNLPFEFSVVGYSPPAWTPVDTVLMEKQFGWSQDGSFDTLKRAVVAEKLGTDVVNELYPAVHEHQSPVIHADDGGLSSVALFPETERLLEPRFVRWLAQFESPVGIGSNSWVVSGKHTDSGQPILAGDPHFPLSAPTQFFEMGLSTPAMHVRGITLPGIPFIVYGQNDTSAWAFTNAYGDAIDFYSYAVDGEQYRYRGEWRGFETAKRELSVKNGHTRTVTVRKTVHGPVIESDGQQVAIAWTGLTATRTLEAFHRLSQASTDSDFVAACRLFDQPVFNLVYANQEGSIRYQHVGRIPKRLVNDNLVSGTRIFDGSDGVGEWTGFTPYDESTWSGFWSFDDQPSGTDQAYFVAANQRIGTDNDHLLTERFMDPYRAQRITELLDERLGNNEPVDVALTKSIQRDVMDGLARELVPLLVAAAQNESDLTGAAAVLGSWDYQMTTDSRAAVLFAKWVPKYATAVFAQPFEAAGLDDVFYPRDWVLSHLDPESSWFDDVSRADLMTQALWEVTEQIGPDTVLGDVNTTGPVDHWFGHPLFDYPDIAVNGSNRTVSAFDSDSLNASSWRMVAPISGPMETVLAGGNDGSPKGAHYADQMVLWAEGNYRDFTHVTHGEPDLSFSLEAVQNNESPVTSTESAGENVTDSSRQSTTQSPSTQTTSPGFGALASILGIAIAIGLYRRKSKPVRDPPR